MPTYFNNEIWDTGGDGRINVLGNLYSSADPFIIYQGDPPVAAITISDSTITFGRAITLTDANFTGNLTVTGSITLTGDFTITGEIVGVSDGILLQENGDTSGFYFGAAKVDPDQASLTLGYGAEFLNILVDLSANTTVISSTADLSLVADNIELTGAITINGAAIQSSTYTTQSVTGTGTVNWNSGVTQQVTLTGSTTISFTNPIVGRTYVLVIVQGGSGSYTPTLTNVNFGDNTPTWATAVGAKDVVSMIWDGTEYLAAYAVANA